MKKLNVFYESNKVGELRQDKELTYSFQYSESWLSFSDKFQLSLAMPLQTQSFGNRITLSYFENLLPEGEVRKVIGRQHRIDSPFDFLKEFGQDCAGAIIVSDSEESPFSHQDKSDMAQIEMSRVYQAIEQNHSVADVIAEMDPGYLSLAGAQDKFAAIYRDGKFYLPKIGSPTTHIVKVPIRRNGVKESVYNEYYCMMLAKMVGFNIPDCQVHEENGFPLFVINRYDRWTDNSGRVHRIHQQDFCQAQGIVSEEKYEEKGGPTLQKNYNLILNKVGIKKRTKSLFSFIDWICFNLLIGNNDSHSKNLSFLLKDNKIELAPFYDLLCTAIYPKLKRQFAYSIGGRVEASRIGVNQFEQLDTELGLKAGTVNERMNLMSEKLGESKDKLVTEIEKGPVKMKITGRISELIEDRIKSLERQSSKK